MSGSNYTVTCPACSKENTVRGKAMTMAMTCASCSMYFRMGQWNKNQTQFSYTTAPSILPGTKGIIDGVKYEVMGFVVKKENKYKYYWREYLLYNPFKGYAFLSEYNGHWNFVWPLEHEPARNKSSDFSYEDNHYRLYQKYSAKVVYAVGEFFFDVVTLTGNTSNAEFISPPYMLALEKSEDSMLWCQGEYLTRQEVASAFSLSINQLPGKTGIGYTQPASTSVKPATMIRFSVILFFLIILLQFFFSQTSEDKIVYQSGFSKADLGDQKFFKTPAFQITGSSKNLELQIQSNLDNDWFFAEFALINEGTGEEYNFTKDIEYYHGYEDGTSWSEGSTVGEALINEIPGGTYHINIYPEFSTQSNFFAMTVKRDVPAASNFYFSMAILALFPLGYALRRHLMERRRWSESDYSPYETNS